MLSIVLLLLLTVFFKGVFFEHIYGASSLTTLQVAVDWRLWTLDGWFWLILGLLIVVSLALNVGSGCLERTCERKRHDMTRSHQVKLDKLQTRDPGGLSMTQV